MTLPIPERRAVQCSVKSNNRLEYATTSSITWKGPEKTNQEKNLLCALQICLQTSSANCTKNPDCASETKIAALSSVFAERQNPLQVVLLIQVDARLECVSE